jgi:hypothetical protein
MVSRQKMLESMLDRTVLLFASKEQLQPYFQVVGP